jgi:hypothetical protein
MIDFKIFIAIFTAIVAFIDTILYGKLYKKRKEKIDIVLTFTWLFVGIMQVIRVILLLKG